MVRIDDGKNAEPTVAIFDAQSTKNTLVASESRGYDGGKKIKGVKKHIAVDTNGLPLAIEITSANKSENYGAKKLIIILRNKKNK